MHIFQAPVCLCNLKENHHNFLKGSFSHATRQMVSTGIKNAIKAAELLAKESLAGPLPLGRIPPMYVCSIPFHVLSVVRPSSYPTVLIFKKRELCQWNFAQSTLEVQRQV